jgi:Uma2 family endonuclease
MNLRERKGTVTFEEFCRTVREDEKADLIDGVIFLASPETTETNDLFCFLSSLIGGFAEEKELGKVFGQRVALRLDGHNGPEPDILFLKAEHADRIQRGNILGPADLAVEIVTPDSVDRDYEKKRRLSEQHGIQEYWIVDEELQQITLLHLGKNGKYREVKPRDGVYQSEVLAGFFLRPEWLWKLPRPKKRTILLQLLEG